MKKIILMLSLMMGLSGMVKAQGLLDKIDRALNKAENTANKVGSSSEKAGRIGGKINNLIGKKEAKGSNFEIQIHGMKLADLKSLSTGLETDKKVGEVKMKFNSSVSTLQVIYNGESDELFELLKKKSPKITDESVQAMEENSISIICK